jgi:hypothetical protein
MTIYYIAVSSWDGRAYTFDYIIPFLSKEQRNERFERMKNHKPYNSADYNLVRQEDDIEDTLKEEEQ